MREEAALGPLTLLRELERSYKEIIAAFAATYQQPLSNAGKSGMHLQMR